MKRISIFFLLAVLLWSCSKDRKENLVPNPKAEQRQIPREMVDNFDPPRSYKELRGCFNDFVKNDNPTFNERYGSDISKKMFYVSDGELSQVVPLFSGDQVENILWINESYFHLIHKADELDENGKPIRNYGKIFLLTKSDIIGGNASLLQDDFQIDNTEERLILNEITPSIGPGEVYSSGVPKSNSCEQWPFQWLIVYYEFFGLPLPIGGDLPPDVIPFSIMEEIIVDITGGACVCPIPCLVIEGLLDHPNVSDDMKEIATATYVMDSYGIDPFLIENTDADLLSDLLYFNCNREYLFDPCTTDPISTDDILDAYFNAIPATADNFYDNLSANDYIILDESLTQDPDCKQLLCIYNMLKEGNDTWCNTIGGFQDLEENTLIFQVGTQGTLLPTSYFNTHPSRKGVTTANSNADIVICFNPSTCDDGPFSQALTILHEGAHADLWRYVSNNLEPGQTITNLSQSTFSQTMNELFNLSCGNPNDPLTMQHEEMLNNYVDDLARGLWEFNGKQSDWENYRYLAYLGIWSSSSACATAVLSVAEFNALKADYQNNVTNNVDLSSCPN